MTKLTDWDMEIEFCLDCEYNGEPLGCNRPQGECAAYIHCFDMWEKLRMYENTEDKDTSVKKKFLLNDDVWFKSFDCENEVEHGIIKAYDLFSNNYLVETDVTYDCGFTKETIWAACHTLYATMKEASNFVKINKENNNEQN